MNASSRPSLRPVESIVIPDKRHGKLIVLRDTQGISDSQAVLPPALVPIVARFTGDRTCAEIAREVSEESGAEVPVDLVVSLAEELDKGLLLEGATFQAAHKRVQRAFAESAVRPASHAGGAYHDDPTKLRVYLDEDCLAKANTLATTTSKKRMTALIAPHIDPWRGAACYGHAYGALARALPDDVDTFILLGTSHAPMREPFALCKKTFATPLGDVPPDEAAVDDLASRAGFDAYGDQFNHKREHSLEFQVVFLKHLMKSRPFRIVPILAGLGEHQAHGTDPERDARATKFLDSIRALAETRGGRAVVVAGADLAHVGPRFGDAAPYGESERAKLERTDRSSLDLALQGDAPSFWQHVARDLDTRRVCGLAPIYSLLRSSSPSDGELFWYEQTVDKEDGSIVSHAAVGFYGST
jgi:AmmeMemoRadiSam system protein B